ncbi:MAG: phosphoadenosine phosphosulfate reductase family protein [Thermoplasmata archaeon]
MSEVRLGKMHLRWCADCNVPVLEQKACGRCGRQTCSVAVTPPGDVRPAFDADIARIRSAIDSQFGPGTGLSAIPEGRVVLLNKAPDIDRMDEVILDGEVVGALRFTLSGGERFLLRPRAAQRIARSAKRGWVRVDAGASKAIREKSASTLAVGVIDCDPQIAPGAEVLVLDETGTAVSVGTAKMTGPQMMERPRGTAVKTRWVVDTSEEISSGRSATWNEVLEANRTVLDKRVREAHEFIKKVVKDNPMPVAVSYSGGKDSLATLLLVLDAGVTPKLLFVDTGLEFRETVENVITTARERGLELIMESAGDAFWRNLDYFGPPAKDFRWCCKTCKLGPATRLIKEHFPEGVLSFIGQRAYESEQRAKKGSVWRNPWTPNQLGASPIQKWTALHVWLYLLSKNARPNPLYEAGLERIGCFMCPATDLGELRKVKEVSREYGRWQKYLEVFAASKGLPAEWLEYDLWRWRRIPKAVLDELGIQPESLRAAEQEIERRPLVLRTTSGYSPCVEGLSMEGAFSRPLDMARVANILNMIGPVTTSPDGNIAEVNRITVFGEGAVMVRAKDEAELERKSKQVREAVTRAMECAGCGICVARCERGALTLDGRIVIDADRCHHCGSCFGPCPVVSFREEQLDI